MGLTVRALWLCAALVTAGLYVPAAAALVHAWRTDTYAGHGALVPAFSVFLLWADRRRLALSPSAPDARGAAVLAVGLGLLALGRAQDSVTVQGLSAVVSLAGLLLWAMGAGWLRRAWFPVSFLACMVPVPAPVVGAFSEPLQRFAASFAATAAWWAGLAVHQRGVVLELPTVTLEVAEICNGLRFLAALGVLAVAFAQVSQPTRGRKLLLVALALPVGVLANGLRVAALVFAVHLVGAHAAQGPIHHGIGKAVWVLALGPLAVIGFVLRRGGGPPAPARPAPRPSIETPSLLERV